MCFPSTLAFLLWRLPSFHVPPGEEAAECHGALLRSGFVLRKLPCSMRLPSALALGGARVLLHHCPLAEEFFCGAVSICAAVQ